MKIKAANLKVIEIDSAKILTCFTTEVPLVTVTTHLIYNGDASVLAVGHRR